MSTETEEQKLEPSSSAVPEVHTDSPRGLWELLFPCLGMLSTSLPSGWSSAPCHHSWSRSGLTHRPHTDGRTSLRLRSYRKLPTNPSNHSGNTADQAPTTVCPAPSLSKMGEDDDTVSDLGTYHLIPERKLRPGIWHHVARNPGVLGPRNAAG